MLHSSLDKYEDELSTTRLELVLVMGVTISGGVRRATAAVLAWVFELAQQLGIVRAAVVELALAAHIKSQSMGAAHCNPPDRSGKANLVVDKVELGRRLALAVAAVDERLVILILDRHLLPLEQLVDAGEVQLHVSERLGAQRADVIGLEHQRL